MAAAGMLLVAVAEAQIPLPRLPKLDPEPVAQPPPVPAPVAKPPKTPPPIEPARPLPPTATVCQDRKARRCWSPPKGTGCPGAEVFVIVIDLPGRFDLDDALMACREQFKHQP